MKTNLTQKITFLFIVAAFISLSSYSQGRLYLNAGIGYNLPAGSMVIGSNSSSNFDENVYGSFGKGFSFGAGVGYMFTPHFGAEINFSCLWGAEYEFTGSQGGVDGIEKVHGKMFRIIPALKVSTGTGNIQPYAKFGLVAGLSPKINSEFVGSSGGASIVGTAKLTDGSSIGWMGAFGIDFNATTNVAVFAEVNTINQTWAPERNDFVVTATANGFSETETGTIIYVDKVFSPSPNQSLKTALPFSSFGINAGIRVFFGAK